MAGSTPIEAGKIVPISMLLHDNDPNKYVRAFVYDDASTLLTTIDLSNTGGGLYSHDSYQMPDINYIRVIYRVYSDAGYTTLSLVHGSDVDIFTNDRNQELLNAINTLLGAVENGLITKGDLKAKLGDDDTALVLVANESQKLSQDFLIEVEEDTIKAGLDDQTIKSVVDETSLKADLKKCEE